MDNLIAKKPLYSTVNIKKRFAHHRHLCGRRDDANPSSTGGRSLGLLGRLSKLKLKHRLQNQDTIIALFGSNSGKRHWLVVVWAGEEESLLLSDIALELVLPKQCERASVC
jgi:hypothetical protein